MDQKKIGGFLRTLRKERGVTQEQLAEVLGVSGRTVSRWETGYNMPDIDLLIELADYYGVEIRELLDGERRCDTVDQEMKETVLAVADYEKHERKKLSRRMCAMFITGAVLFTLFVILEFFVTAQSHVLDFIKGCAMGFAYGMMIVGILYTSGALFKLKAFKQRMLNRD